MRTEHFTRVRSLTMKWILGDAREDREGVAGVNGLGGVKGDFMGFLDFNRPMSSCTRLTVKLIDSRPTLISRL